MFVWQVMPQAEPQDIEFFSRLTACLAMFVQGFPISIDTHNLNVDTEVASPNEKLRAERQVLVRDMGILQLCILFLDKLMKVSVEGDKLKLASKAFFLIIFYLL